MEEEIIGLDDVADDFDDPQLTTQQRKKLSLFFILTALALLMFAAWILLTKIGVS